MATTPKSSLRYPVLSDTANVPRDLGNLSTDLDGRVHTVCTRTTRPSGSGLFDGHLIYETDTQMWRSYVAADSRWKWVGGKTQYMTLNLASQAMGASATSAVNLPATPHVATTNDPNGVFTLNSAAKNITVNVPGIYTMTLNVSSSVNGWAAIFQFNAQTYGTVTSPAFAPNGSLAFAFGPWPIITVPYTFSPTFYIYSTAGTMAGGWLNLTMISEL